MKLTFTCDSEHSFGIHEIPETGAPVRLGETNSEAAARLFVTAPDMLEALRLAAVGLETAARNTGLWGNANGLPAEFERRAELCRAAIAKAREPRA